MAGPGLGPVGVPSVTCACGCDQVFTPGRERPTRPQRYISGHQNRRLRKASVRVLSEPRRLSLYEQAGNRCQGCGLSMAEQVERFGRRLEIHHVNHDHEDNRLGNHEVLCTACHNKESLAVRDEAKKANTLRMRYRTGVIKHHTASQTHCKRGHAFTADNLYADKPGRRRCRACCLLQKRGEHKELAAG